MAEIRPKIDALNARIDRVFAAELDPALTGAGIDIMDWKALDADDRDHLGQVFEEQIFPVLTPLAVDPSHPFPFISNLSLNLGVVTRNPNRMGTQFAPIKLPPVLPRFIQLPDQARFVKREEQ